jgi:diguanylate cyclase (GGDEF)-like protein
LDIDQFRQINEIYGRDAGDALLERTADLLKSKMHARDTLARLRADHFAVLFENCSFEEAVSAANTLCEVVSTLGFSWHRRAVDVSASIGVTELSPKQEDAASVMSSAEQACRTAKEAGGGRVHGFAASHTDQARPSRDAQWVERITRALAEDRLTLFRQRIAGLQTSSDADVACELIVRMIDERGDTVEPGAFFAAVSRCGMWPSIDDWVIKRALDWLRSSATEDLTMCSINISGQSMRDEKLPAYLAERLRDSMVDAAKICFELDERSVMENLPGVRHFMKELRILGCRFALDNFGTGYSSFSYLKMLPLDFLKIDGSFVRELTRNTADQEMARAINGVAHALGIKSIAVCAESREIVDVLRVLGVDYAQGYWVSMPRAL